MYHVYFSTRISEITSGQFKGTGVKTNAKGGADAQLGEKQ
jgi:hypothetical protein